MTRHRASLAIAAWVLAVAIGLTVGAPADAGSAGWINVCAWSHALPDDPIVFRHRPGASHLHEFFGSDLTSADSNATAMRLDGTSCTLPEDTGAYWVPAFYLDGARVVPDQKEEVYYRDSNLDAGTPVVAFPRGLKMIAGNAHATSAAENPELGSALYYGCSDNSTEKLVAPPPSCPEGIISVHVGFPNCWNGIDLDSADHASHVAYPHGGACPSAFPVALPRLILRLEFSGDGAWSLASGASYTLHADFWNTWRQPKLRTLVRDCLNADKDCGTL